MDEEESDCSLILMADHGIFCIFCVFICFFGFGVVLGLSSLGLGLELGLGAIYRFQVMLNPPRRGGSRPSGREGGKHGDRCTEGAETGRPFSGASR